MGVVSGSSGAFEKRPLWVRLPARPFGFPRLSEAFAIRLRNLTGEEGGQRYASTQTRCTAPTYPDQIRTVPDSGLDNSLPLSEHREGLTS